MDKESDEEVQVSSENVLSTAVDSIGDIISGIPTPIRKNLFKVIAQFSTALVDIPVAWLEGIAAEKRAETQSRIKIINTSAEQIASQMNVPLEYAKAAGKKYAGKIIRESINLDDITRNAAKELAVQPSRDDESNNRTTETEDISDDWLNAFEQEACNKSSEEMKLLFGKILAQEIRKPSSFSIKTIKIMSQLDNSAAKLFQKFCSYCISLRLNEDIIDARVASLGGNPGDNNLMSYGLGWKELNILHEYGLIISDYNSYMTYPIGYTLTYRKKKLILTAMQNSKNKNSFKIAGVALSNSGKELMDIIDILPDEKYTDNIFKYFNDNNLNILYN